MDLQKQFTPPRGAPGLWFTHCGDSLNRSSGGQKSQGDLVPALLGKSLESEYECQGIEHRLGAAEFQGLLDAVLNGSDYALIPIDLVAFGGSLALLGCYAFVDQGRKCPGVDP